MNKIILPFLLAVFFTTSTHAKVEAPRIAKNCIDEFEVFIEGQEQLDAFFDKVKRGKQQNAYYSDREYYYNSKQLQTLRDGWFNISRRNQVEQLPKEIGNLTKLKCLDLSNNQLTTIPKEIKNLTKLERLYLSSNTLTTLPKEIGNLVSLEWLNLVNNKFESIPKEIRKLTKLKCLDLSDNKLTSLPKEIEKLANLEHLFLSNNELTLLPREIGSLVSLTSLHLENNEFESIPVEIRKLTKLSWIYLNRNPIKYIPSELKEWRPYLFSKLGGNVFLPVPQSDCGLLTLSHPREQVWLRDECKRNPEFKKQIKRIEYTELLNETVRPQSCSVDCWPTDAGSSIENKVTIVFESREQLENFALESELFKWTGELERIQVLNLQNLQLTEIPEFVFKCKNLERLFLEDNYIEDVPEIISELKELTFLSLGNNRMHKLPRSLRKFTKLRGLLLDANPLDAMDPIPNLRHLKYLEFISMNSEVANRLGMEAISNEDQKIIDSEIPDMSVMVKPSVSRHSNYCVIS